MQVGLSVHKVLSSYVGNHRTLRLWAWSSLVTGYKDLPLPTVKWGQQRCFPSSSLYLGQGMCMTWFPWSIMKNCLEKCTEKERQMRTIHLPKNSSASICFFFFLKMEKKLLAVTMFQILWQSYIFSYRLFPFDWLKKGHLEVFCIETANFRNMELILENY